ncbi:T9SS C-terminal target domain-containing protein [Flavobacterium circumlabens]|uniref:Secreted protein (Por secretion system target) n=1 Tax=Flavobacterium circumlabens TaxID=2133765 RepID=A0A4Y7UIB5_9FLAO|nr:T9SS type A sorting domain-containing protein [Flavobacterium circumlabens]TCN61007.1 putative secreted protein (Por secretion system target) [Flavobacterium circumlabens]TEB46124.1 T9SS C-terminal target domain-containing protein [Flavobacterium circumlabens]
MKTKLLLLLLLANFSVFAQTNLVPDGGFDNWTGNTPNSWTTTNSISQSTDAATGQYSAKLSLTAGLSPKIIAQVPLKSGITYTVKFKYKYLNSNYSGSHPIALKLYNDESGSSISSSAFASNNAWTEKETTFTPSSDLTFNLSFSTFSFDDEPFDVLIDDVKVYSDQVEEYTSIPDINFENKLIDLGIDSGVADGKVLTSSISELTFLDVSNSLITDLTGIEAFTSLTNLDCSKNKLKNIDLSQNVALTYLNIGRNELTNLDVTKNVLLTSLDFQRNSLTDIDLSENISLERLTAMLNQLTTLNVSKNTELDDFDCRGNKLTSLDIQNNTKLTSLNCGNNFLTSLNVSKNVLLLDFYCYTNQLTSLDVSQNILLQGFMCNDNKLTAIDVSKNPDIYMFDCLDNKLTSVDISKNPKITELACENNQLTYLNLKNGNNTKIELGFTNFRNNPNLTCIEVDDVAYSNAKWMNIKDAAAAYSATCTKLGLADSVFDQAVVYPNPTKGEVSIDNISIEKATVYNTSGQLVKTIQLDAANTNNTVSLAGLPKGIYYIYLINQDAASAKKIILE